MAKGRPSSTLPRSTGGRGASRTPTLASPRPQLSSRPSPTARASRPPPRGERASHSTAIASSTPRSTIETPSEAGGSSDRTTALLKTWRRWRPCSRLRSGLTRRQQRSVPPVTTPTRSPVCSDASSATVATSPHGPRAASIGRDRAADSGSAKPLRRIGMLPSTDKVSARRGRPQ